MFKWLLKPVRKIGHEETKKEEQKPAKKNIAKEIMSICDIDDIVADVVTSRVLICTHTDSVEQLFECLYQNGSAGNQQKVAVSLGMYFRGLRIPPSEAMRRLSDQLDSMEKVPGRVTQDLTTLLTEIQNLKSVNNQELK